jgi:hypothetical protein
MENNQLSPGVKPNRDTVIEFTYRDLAQQLLNDPELICPHTGEGTGVNVWTLRFARRAALIGLPIDDARDEIYSRAVGCGRRLKASEVERSLSKAYTENGAHYTPQATPTKIAINHELIDRISKQGPTLEQIQESSPDQFDESGRRTALILTTLFAPTDLINASGVRESDGITRILDEWLERPKVILTRQQFIVPNPMAKTWGINKDGNESARCLDNTGPRMYFVAEFDFGEGTDDKQAALIAHLAQFAPLVMIVDSGGKSLHGWFRVYGAPEEKIERFIDYAVSLGADKQLRVRCQYCRMPDATRNNGKRQRVLYFNRKAAVIR